MSEKILVTGINGFVGHHVARQLHERGYNVIGTGQQQTIQEDLLDVCNAYVSCDLTNPEEVKKIDLSSVTAIINLAGFAKVGDSKGQGELYNRVNVGVHSVLYEECLAQNVYPRIIAVSTGAVYDPNQPLPITEDSALTPRDQANEYIVSKQLVEEAVTGFNARGLDCIIARPFNHSGPGQLPGFLLPDLGEQIKSAATSNSTLLVGNLDTKRDFTDVRDVARAYVILATCDKAQLKHSIYNICSGKSIAGRAILKYMIKAYGATSITTKVDPARIRSNEIMDIYGSRERLSTDLDWVPEISVKQMVEDFVAWQKTQ